jgi:GH15 family glucan-1,4-alpha-glucosidase
MASRIEDYGLSGNMRTAAIVSRSGSIDWLCAPRFDSDAFLAALLGYDEHGCWSIRPATSIRETRQRYREDSLVLETEFVCDGGTVRVTDFMPLGSERCDVVRIVEGLEGDVSLEMMLMPDDGIWEVRGGRRHFTHSKVMAWVAIDRSVKALEEWGMGGDEGRDLLPHLRAVRERIHAEVCERGFNPRVGAFTQSYGSEHLDASVLVIPQYGFLPATDPRMTSTITSIENNLMRDGFVLRYDTQSGADGLPGTEGAFLACSFWLAHNYALAGRIGDAEELFVRLLDDDLAEAEGCDFVTADERLA